MGAITLVTREYSSLKRPAVFPILPSPPRRPRHTQRRPSRRQRCFLISIITFVLSLISLFAAFPSSLSLIPSIIPTAFQKHSRSSPSFLYLCSQVFTLGIDNLLAHRPSLLRFANLHSYTSYKSTSSDTLAPLFHIACNYRSSHLTDQAYSTPTSRKSNSPNSSNYESRLCSSIYPQVRP